MSVVSVPDAVAITFAGQCERGLVREENQDSVLHRSTPLGDLLIVADGIGGYAGGGVASFMAVETISSYVAGMPTFFPPEIAIEEAASHANAAIAAAAAEPESPNNRMGSTAVVALLRADSDRARAPVQALIGNIGDSRAYLVHNRKLTQLTRDHSAIQELLDAKLMTPEEAKEHADASLLTRCLGREPHVQIDIREVPLEVGDTLLLCSDGLWGYVSDEEIERVVADPALDAEAASQALLDLALAAGGHDNVGIQIARISVPGIHTAARAQSFTSPPQPEPLPLNPIPAFIPEPSLPAPVRAAAFVYKPAPAPVSVSAPLLEAFTPTKTNPARYAESMMLPELIVVPHVEPISAPQSSHAAPQRSVRAQIGFARLAAIFLLAFAASSTLAYVAVVNGWIGVLR
jgi:serine/threonine protein phosphatase PrpC